MVPSYLVLPNVTYIQRHLELTRYFIRIRMVFFFPNCKNLFRDTSFDEGSPIVRVTGVELEKNRHVGNEGLLFCIIPFDTCLIDSLPITIALHMD